MISRLTGRTADAPETPQSQPLPNTTQVANSAGGYSWAVSDWTRLQRFLILGSEGGSYYASERALSLESAAATLRCIAEDGPRVVAMIVEISHSGRAPKNDPALFTLALCASKGDDETRRAALAALPQVARIGTHLMHFAAFIDAQRGWGRGLRSAIADWYNAKPAKDAAYQALKYQSRDGWSQRDLLRLAHPKAPGESHQTLYHWITRGWDGVGDEPHPDEALQQVWAFERAKRASTCDEIVALIRAYNLPREAIPTQFLNEAAVWEALLESMPMTALIRNLATLTRVGLIAPNSDAVQRVREQITNAERLKRARVHPIALLAALKTYAQGRGERGSNTWKPVPAIVDALDEAFYLSFGSITPSGKKYVLALDVSGSMAGGSIAGVPGLTPRVASAAMALITAATEKQYQVMGFSTQFVPLGITPRQRLDDALRKVSNLPFSGTDCALPMTWALKNKVEADAFVVYTDSETWFGGVHPAQALRQYRDKMGRDAKLIVVGMVANKFTIADPNDAGMMDIVGFDTATPQLMSDFVSGQV
jgi:60 kDa SS-A/Ro ribonucleoprotein